MTRRLTLVLLAVLGLSGGLRLIAEDVILVPGTISGSISLGGTVCNLFPMTYRVFCPDGRITPRVLSCAVSIFAERAAAIGPTTRGHRGPG